ncbi:MAG: ferredoxin--NADP reductase [Cytophagales bacterium]|nr:MAG: ferredoxin--NADP reductase [Cytophagales bacterium]
MKFHTLKVKDITKETLDTITVHLKQPLFSKIKYKAGQFLTVVVPIEGKSVRRAYSLSSAPNIDETLSITIKRVENGLVSNYVNDHLKVDDKMEIIEPMGNFFVEPDKNLARHIVLFGAGSGITPLMSIAKSILAFEPKSIVSLVYGNRNSNTIIFKSKIEEMQKKYGERFNVVHVLSQAENDWVGYKGRIDKTIAINVLNLLPKFDKDKTEYFICGPEGMTKEVENALKNLQVPKERIHHESFISSASSEAKEEAKKGGSSTEREITILLDNEEYRVKVSDKKTILEAGLDAGLDMPYSCQSGLCTACRGRRKSGEIKMDEDEGLSALEIKDGYILACVSHPLTDDVVIEIG